jgi:hypothetical protein
MRDLVVRMAVRIWDVTLSIYQELAEYEIEESAVPVWQGAI